MDPAFGPSTHNWLMADKRDKISMDGVLKRLPCRVKIVFMPQNDTLCVCCDMCVSSYLLSEGDFISFVSIDVQLMTTLLVSLLKEIESAITCSAMVEFMFLLPLWFCCVVVVSNDIIY